VRKKDTTVATPIPTLTYQIKPLQHAKSKHWNITNPIERGKQKSE
jgi:hypothetical protein